MPDNDQTKLESPDLIIVSQKITSNLRDVIWESGGSLEEYWVTPDQIAVKLLARWKRQ